MGKYDDLLTEESPSPTPAATGKYSDLLDEDSGRTGGKYSDLLEEPPSDTPETDKVLGTSLGLAAARAYGQRMDAGDVGAAVAEYAKTPGGIQDERFSGAVLNTIKGMVPHTAEAAKETFIPFMHDYMQIKRVTEGLQQGKPVQQIAEETVPTYRNIRQAFRMPVGSQEWWDAVVPLGLEAAMGLAAGIGLAGAAGAGAGEAGLATTEAATAARAATGQFSSVAEELRWLAKNDPEAFKVRFAEELAKRQPKAQPQPSAGPQPIEAEIGGETDATKVKSTGEVSGGDQGPRVDEEAPLRRQPQGAPGTQESVSAPAAVAPTAPAADEPIISDAKYKHLNRKANAGYTLTDAERQQVIAYENRARAPERADKPVELTPAQEDAFAEAEKRLATGDYFGARNALSHAMENPPNTHPDVPKDWDGTAAEWEEQRKQNQAHSDELYRRYNELKARIEAAGKPIAKIVNAAIKNQATGKVYTGPSHPQIYNDLPNSAFKGVEEGAEPDYFTGEGWNSPEGLIDGFVDENGKFYYRDEALQQAVKARQYKPTGKGDELLELNELQRQEAEQARVAPQAASKVTPTQEPIMSVGAASREEYMRRYAIAGARHILEGKSELGMFSMEMVKEFGRGIDELLPEIFQRAGQLINELQTATGKSDVAREINKLSGVTKARETPVLVRPFVAQKAAYAQAERAGKAGYTRGMREARAEAKAAMAQFKGDMNMADKFMAGDQEQVRKNLVNFVNAYLPPGERGRFINRITAALARPSLQRGDPMPMYRKAFDVMQDIEARAEAVFRDNLIDDISKVARRAMDSPSVDLDAKRLMQRLLSDINLRNISARTRASLEATRDFINRMRGQGKDVLMPEKVLAAIESLGKRSIQDLPTADLEALHTKMALLERLGRLRFRNRAQMWAAEKALRIDDMMKGPGSPLELRTQFKPQPGEKVTARQKIDNHLKRVINSLQVFDLAHLPQDVMFDMMQDSKGSYAGPLFDHVRTPVDAVYDAAENRSIAASAMLREITRNHKLSDQDEDLIGLWATLEQDGGEARALESGVTQDTIDKLKARGLTPGQKAAYDYMRQSMDQWLPEIQDVMHELFNVQVVPERNYFPWMREFDIFNPGVQSPVIDPKTGQAVPQSELHNFGKIAGNFFKRNTSQLPRGFTIERLPGAETPIRMDSFAVYERHMRNAARLIEMQRTLKMSGEMLRDPSFALKYGKYGQDLTNEWLTAAAVDGAGMNVHRVKFIDLYRRGTNRSEVFFRLTSNIKHASAIPQGFVNSGGPQYWWRGLHGQLTPEGKEFLANFPQIMSRQAGDVSLQELQDTMNRMPLIRFADKWGFVLGKELDAINSRAVFIGRYLKNLQDAGLNPTLSGPVNKKAAYNAMVFMRRTVSSTLAKDIQPALGRGMGFGGYVSLARIMNAFRQYALERWSLMRYDIPEAFRSGNYTRALAIMGAVGAATIYEVNIQRELKAAWRAIFHIPESKTDKESLATRMILDLGSMVPYASNVIAAYRWGETGITGLDLPVSGFKAARSAVSGKQSGTRARGALRAGFTAAEMLGVPGAGVLESYLTPYLFPPREKAVKEPKGGRAGRSVPRGEARASR